MVIAKFQYKGNEYDYKGLCKVKVDDSWIDAVMYCSDGNVYVRELLDFFLNFKCLEAKNPMPGNIYLRKQKTVTDIIHDQLGPGYMSGFEADKTQIPAYEVGCETISLKDENQDDVDSNRSK